MRLFHQTPWRLNCILQQRIVVDRQVTREVLWMLLRIRRFDCFWRIDDLEPIDVYAAIAMVLEVLPEMISMASIREPREQAATTMQHSQERKRLPRER
jgi:hypothetical protein